MCISYSVGIKSQVYKKRGVPGFYLITSFFKKSTRVIPHPITLSIHSDAYLNNTFGDSIPRKDIDAKGGTANPYHFTVKRQMKCA